MKMILITLLGILFCFFTPQAGFGCSCSTLHLEGRSEEYQVNYAREHADAIFSGIVTEVVITYPPSANSSSETAINRFEAKFQVRKSWKGVDSEKESLFGWTGCCFCEYHFKTGESYLVYAFRDKETNRLGTSICLRTQPLAGAAEDLRYLGEGTVWTIDIPPRQVPPEKVLPG